MGLCEYPARCDTCEGGGKINQKVIMGAIPSVKFANVTKSALACSRLACPACNGTGVVWRRNDGAWVSL